MFSHAFYFPHCSMLGTEFPKMIGPLLFLWRNEELVRTIGALWFQLSRSILQCCQQFFYITLPLGFSKVHCNSYESPQALSLTADKDALHISELEPRKGQLLSMLMCASRLSSLNSRSLLSFHTIPYFLYYFWSLFILWLFTFHLYHLNYCFGYSCFIPSVLFEVSLDPHSISKQEGYWCGWEQTRVIRHTHLDYGAK